MMEKFRDNFREEAYELLNSLESSLLALEDDPTDEEQISAVFRSMHTIKGSAAMFGFDHISSFTHEVESVLELVRSGLMRVDEKLTSLTLRARDHVRELLDYGEPASAELVATSEELMQEYRALAAGRASEGGTEAAVEKPVQTREQEKSDRPESTYRIRFEPDASIFQNGTNPLLLLKELHELGDCSCIPYVERLPTLEEINPESCHTAWDVILTTKADVNAIRDVFIFVEDAARIDIQVIDQSDLLDDGPHKRIGQILEERGVVDRERIERAVHSQKRLGELLVENEGIDPAAVESALEEQNHLERARQRVQSELASSSIRVRSEKLDQLVDLVGELVTLQARLSQTVVTESLDGQLLGIAESLERLTSELRDSTMSIRMLPIGTTFSKFKRLVRDLSNELGKSVEIVTEGGETELDKTVIEKLNDPLVHIIRNSIDHGIEKPELRRAAGKRESGTIRLTATHSGASVLIRITDDGAGLNRERIRAKAVERGIISADSKLTDEETAALICAPGFSTADQVTKVSGRGVGMDVVRKEIESLGGTLQIESQDGQGMTTTLAIPLTLAIIEGLLVDVAGEKYVFPLSSITECIELTAEMRSEHRNRRMLENRGEILPYVSLREVFRVGGDTPEVEQIVVTNVQDRKVGFVVDQVVGDYQTVIKNLGRMYRDVEGVSGATILGDGSVALIVDVPHLSQIVVSEQRGRAAVLAER
ncbi:chemotaxis protein CheW [Salinispira pacifica]